MADKYRVILADPPWDYEHGKRGAARNHYQTTPTSVLAQMPISALGDKNAALLMWATMPKLPEALTLMQSWGFEYRTVAFSWVKLNKDGSPFKGLGHYTRSNTELCLLGVRGSMPRKAKNISQVLLTPRREHSRKPDQQYSRIMRLFDGPYLELFARQQWPGWDVWGNQTNLFPAQPFLFDEGYAA